MKKYLDFLMSEKSIQKVPIDNVKYFALNSHFLRINNYQLNIETKYNNTNTNNNDKSVFE